MSKTQQQGQLSINTTNILPIIKKWLYSDHDIFIRELVSNAFDAITKRQKLVTLDDAIEFDESPNITITIDKKKKTLTISDNGLGMTEDEVQKYITQIAFSGAEDFVKKYESEEKDAGIIGHFGLGFYSSFMVANTVEIQTLSCQKEANRDDKALEHHFVHLVLHGMLHLNGFDHINGDDAQEMEAEEREILSALQIPDPYDDKLFELG